MNKLFLFALIFVFFACKTSEKDKLEPVINHSSKQIEYALQNINSLCEVALLFPRTTENNVLKLVPASDWTSMLLPRIFVIRPILVAGH
jgi:hypothetical protein